MDFVDKALDILTGIGTNRQNLRLLLQYQSKLVPFIGAGLSAEFDYPPWNRLVQTLADQTGNSGLKARVERLLVGNQFEEAAELVSRFLSNAFDDTLRDVFDEHRLPRPLQRGAIRHVPLITDGPVLTTNFDRVIERAFEEAGRKFSDIFPGTRIHEALRAIQLSEQVLLKMHGDYLDSASRVLTLSQYRRAYGHADPSKADLTLPIPKVLGLALAARPLFFLGCSLTTDRTIGIVSRISRTYEGTIHFALMSESDNTPDRRKQLDGWNIRPIFYPKGKYEKINDLLLLLAQHRKHESDVAGIPRSTRVRRPPRPRIVRINGYKLFYFRLSRNLSLAELAERANIRPEDLNRLESVRSRPGHTGPQCFALCERALVFRLERILDCAGKLETGPDKARLDDFLTQYRHVYELYKRKNRLTPRNEHQMEMPFATKAVVFDFDGTLTVNADGQSTWEKIWRVLGYPANKCSDLHTRYMHGEFTHERWCQITEEAFKKRGFNERQLKRIARETHLIRGAAETIRKLKQSGLRVYIVSGSIKQVIKERLGRLYDFFDDVKANEMMFDESGGLTMIRGTFYDFEGKARFLKQVVRENGIDQWEVLFVGNSRNDDWASLAGVRTLCINPHKTRPDDRAVWTYARERVESLTEILEFIKI
jgi:HAD superfamily phosphoserine phosphatase-like hydrolase